MAGAASQAEDADSSQAPGITSGLQESVNVHRCEQHNSQCTEIKYITIISFTQVS